MKLPTTKYILLTSVFILLSVIVLAQPAGGAPPGGPSGGGTPPCWPPPCIPIDGGLSFLIAIGAAFGGKKAYDHYKSDEITE
ncbi:MAG: hypothetical protein ACI9N1_002887 [Flavobacteriales bacterium]|jgi:hypothetical protein